MAKEFKLSKEGNSRITDKTETQKILPDGCYLLFDEHLQKKNTLKLCRDSGKCFEGSLRVGKVVENLEIF